jgi:hypothetical protein
MERANPWPSIEEGEHDPGSMGERLKPAGGVTVADI